MVVFEELLDQLLNHAPWPVDKLSHKSIALKYGEYCENYVFENIGHLLSVYDSGGYSRKESVGSVAEVHSVNLDIILII